MCKIVKNLWPLLLACLLWLASGSGAQAETMYQIIGKRADETRSELKSAREEQRDQAAALDRAEGAIRDSAERADRVQSLERSDAEIIRESQSIIDRVRERGPAQGTDKG